MSKVNCPKCDGRGVYKESRPVNFADYKSETVKVYCELCNRTGKVNPSQKKQYKNAQALKNWKSKGFPGSEPCPR